MSDDDKKDDDKVVDIKAFKEKKDQEKASQDFVDCFIFLPKLNTGIDDLKLSSTEKDLLFLVRCLGLMLLKCEETMYGIEGEDEDTDDTLGKIRELLNNGVTMCGMLDLQLISYLDTKRELEDDEE